VTAYGVLLVLTGLDPFKLTSSLPGEKASAEGLGLLLWMSGLWLMAARFAWKGVDAKRDEHHRHIPRRKHDPGQHSCHAPSGFGLLGDVFSPRAEVLVERRLRLQQRTLRVVDGNGGSLGLDH